MHDRYERHTPLFDNIVRIESVDGAEVRKREFERRIDEMAKSAYEEISQMYLSAKAKYVDEHISAAAFYPEQMAYRNIYVDQNRLVQQQQQAFYDPMSQRFIGWQQNMWFGGALAGLGGGLLGR